MAQILQDAIDKKAGASQRSSDVAANAAGAATSAADVAASKRSRASLSSGPVVGPGGLAAAPARQGDISADAKATMTLADMIHSTLHGMKRYFCILSKFYYRSYVRSHCYCCLDRALHTRARPYIPSRH